MINNAKGVASKGHVEGDSRTKDNVHNFVRRSNRMRNVPARFRNLYYLILVELWVEWGMGIMTVFPSLFMFFPLRYFSVGILFYH